MSQGRHLRGTGAHVPLHRGRSCRAGDPHPAESTHGSCLTKWRRSVSAVAVRAIVSSNSSVRPPAALSKTMKAKPRRGCSSNIRAYESLTKTPATELAIGVTPRHRVELRDSDREFLCSCGLEIGDSQPVAPESSRCCAVCFWQWFGSWLQLTPHLHLLKFDDHRFEAFCHWLMKRGDFPNNGRPRSCWLTVRAIRRQPQTSSWRTFFRATKAMVAKWSARAARPDHLTHKKREHPRR